MNRNKKKKAVSAAMSVVTSVQNLFECFEESSSGEDTEEEELVFVLEAMKQIGNFNKQKVTRIILYVEKTVANYTEKQFQQHFRLSREAYENLLHKIGPALQRKGCIGRKTISVDKQVLATIWLLATPDSFRSVGDRFDMGKSSLSVSFFRVVEALNDIAPVVITWPSGARLQYIREAFKSLARLDNVVGVVDGTFILIKAPKEDPEVYVTRKCNYAVTLQGMCDCDLKFTDVFVGYPGSVSDTRIFRNSDYYSKVSEHSDEFFPNREFIIGDKAYPVLMWCIPPYINRGTLTRAQRNFNDIHSKTRQTIERCFALLFGHFRRLKFLDMNRHDLIPATVLATCVLHNICLDHDELFREQFITEGREDVYHNEEHCLEELEIPNNQQAKSRRDNICYGLYYN